MDKFLALELDIQLDGFVDKLAVYATLDKRIVTDYENGFIRFRVEACSYPEFIERLKLKGEEYNFAIL